MSDEIEVLEQGGGSPLRREVDCEGRTGREQHSPSDPRTTPETDEDDRLVEEGGQVRDTAADGFGDVKSPRRSPDRHLPYYPSVARQQRSTVNATAAQQLRSVVTKPVQQRPANGRGRATNGASAWQPSRPGLRDKAAGGDRHSTITYQ